MWDGNDAEVQKEGLRARLARLLPVSQPLRLQLLGEFVDRFLQANLRPLTTLLSYDEWEESTTYPQPRKDQLRAAWDRMVGGKPNRKQRRTIRAFIKAESYVKVKYPRWINSRTDEWKAYAGRIVKSIENEVYKLKWFIKHVPVPERPAKIEGLMRAGARYFVGDFTAFEASITPAVMEVCENKLYRYMLSNFADDAELICRTNAGWNEGRTRLGTRFRVKGRRMSGDMWTSLGNGFTNLMVNLFLAECNGAVIDGFVEGDDSVFALYSGEYATPDQFAELGFSMKLDEFRHPGHGRFCGMQCHGGVNLIDPHRCMQKLPWIFGYDNAGPRVCRELLRGKCLSAIWESPSCPIVSPVARALLAEVGQGPARSDGSWASAPTDFKVPPYEPTLESRLAFERLFGISVAAQLLIEKSLLVRDFTPLRQLIPLTWDDVNARRFTSAGFRSVRAPPRPAGA